MTKLILILLLLFQDTNYKIVNNSLYYHNFKACEVSEIVNQYGEMLNDWNIDGTHK